jgi:hypothetical protein
MNPPVGAWNVPSLPVRNVSALCRSRSANARTNALKLSFVAAKFIVSTGFRICSDAHEASPAPTTVLNQLPLIVLYKLTFRRLSRQFPANIRGCVAERGSQVPRTRSHHYPSTRRALVTTHRAAGAVRPSRGSDLGGIYFARPDLSGSASGLFNLKLADVSQNTCP